MNPITYLKQNGIRHTFDVLYQYKISRALLKVFKPIFTRLPIQNKIFIESHNDFDCNGGAIYEYLLKNGYNEKYKIVWNLKHKKPKKLPYNVSAVYVFKPSLRKVYHICTAKYFLSDNNITEKIRDEQIAVHCGHGHTSLKNCKGLIDAPKGVDYFIMPSENFAPILSMQSGEPFPSKRYIYTGHPCLDVFFSSEPDDFEKITDQKFRKKIMWMPTFRKGGGHNRNDSAAVQPLGIPLIESAEELERLNDFLEKENILLVIKLHPMQDPDSYKNLKETRNIRVLNGQDVKRLGIDNYRLMKGADAMISDYSSAIFQFLQLNRPMAFVLSDLKDYTIGLCVDNVEDYLVGHKIFTYDDFVGFVKDVAAGKDEYSEKRLALCGWMYNHCDGNSSQRLIEFLGV